MPSTLSLPTPVGTFHAHSTRDGVGWERDGQPFFAHNRLEENDPEANGTLWEVEFADGVWILARTPDLTWAEPPTDF